MKFDWKKVALEVLKAILAAITGYIGGSALF